MNLLKDKPCKLGHTSPRRKSGNCIQCEKERYNDPKRKEYVKAKQAERRAIVKADPVKAAAHKAYMRQYVIDNRNRLNTQTSVRYFRNPRKRIAQRLKRLNIITTEILIDTILDHKGFCDICGKIGDGRWNELAIDHCHITHTFRGMLCSSCNRAIGLFKDNENLLDRAVSYLQSHRNNHAG